MKGANVGVLYTLGTGVGGGIVINQKSFLEHMDWVQK